EDDSLAARISLAPVVGMALELEPAPRIEGDHAEWPRPDHPALPAPPREVRPLRNDRRRRIGEHRREERDGLLEVQEELVRRDAVEALDVGGQTVEERR